MSINVQNFCQKTPESKKNSIYYTVEFVACAIQEKPLDLYDYQLKIDRQSSGQIVRRND